MLTGARYKRLRKAPRVAPACDSPSGAEARIWGISAPGDRRGWRCTGTDAAGTVAQAAADCRKCRDGRSPRAADAVVASGSVAETTVLLRRGDLIGSVARLRMLGPSELDRALAAARDDQLAPLAADVVMSPVPTLGGSRRRSSARCAAGSCTAAWQAGSGRTLSRSSATWTTRRAWPRSHCSAGCARAPRARSSRRHPAVRARCRASSEAGGGARAGRADRGNRSRGDGSRGDRSPRLARCSTRNPRAGRRRPQQRPRDVYARPVVEPALGDHGPAAPAVQLRCRPPGRGVHRGGWGTATLIARSRP